MRAVPTSPASHADPVALARRRHRRRRGARVAGRADAERARPAHHPRHADVHAGAVSARRRRRSRVAAGAARDSTPDRTPSTGVPAAEVPDRIRALGDVALARTTVAFDGVPAASTFQFLPTATGAPGGPSGEAPGGSSGETAGGPSGANPPGTGRGVAAAAGDDPLHRRRAGRRAPVPRHVWPGARVVRADAGEPGGQRSAPIWIAGGQPSPALDLRAGFVDPPWWTTAHRIRRPGLHAHPAQGPRSHPVRGRPVPAGHALAPAAAAGDALHDRALGHARPLDAGHRVAAVVDRRAADRLLDRLRRGREPVHDRALALARRAGLPLRPAARPRVRRRPRRARHAARPVRAGPRLVQRRRRARPVVRDRAGRRSPWAGGACPISSATAAGSSSPSAWRSPSSASTGPPPAPSVEPCSEHARSLLRGTCRISVLRTV